jgi:hypothetical protein
METCIFWNRDVIHFCNMKYKNYRFSFQLGWVIPNRLIL